MGLLTRVIIASTLLRWYEEGGSSPSDPFAGSGWLDERMLVLAATRMRPVLFAAAALLVAALLAAAFSARAAEARYVSGEAVVAEAQTWLGVPYVYGGASRAGVDCSGLTMKVYEAFGVRLPHNAAAQFGYGVPSGGKAGDLVFQDFGYGGITHVGIAVGDGRQINAPYPGTVVRYDPIYPEYTVGYRSIF